MPFANLSMVCYTRYLNLPDETAARFDSEGFFKTGDIVRREKGRYIFQGRANMDCEHVVTVLVTIPY